MKKARIVRLLAAALILATAGLLYHQQQRKAEIAELIPGCGRPEADPEAAIRDCTELLAVSGHSSEDLSAIHRFRGRAHVKLEDFATALADFEQAALANPNDCRVWQWKSGVLDDLNEFQAALDAIENAYQLCPLSNYAVKQRFRLLQKLDRRNEAEVFLTGLVEKYRSAEGENRVPRLRKLGQLLLDLDQHALAAEGYKTALLTDLTHKETFHKFFEACTGAGSDCLPLFPERRGGYPELSCENAITQWAELFPKFVEGVLSDSGFATLHDFFQKGGLRAQVLFQAGYVGTAGIVSAGFPSEYSAQFIVEDRVFECVNGGKFVFPDGMVDEEELRFSNENLFSPQVRGNLRDLAHAALNQ